MSIIHLSQFLAKSDQVTKILNLPSHHHAISDYFLNDLSMKSFFLPSHSIFLGLAGADMPIIFDWTDQKTHSILIVDDDTATIRHLMLSMIRSISFKNSPEDIQYIMISNDPDQWMKTISQNDINYDFCAGVVGSNEISAEDWIIYLAQKAEKRLEGKEWGASIILFIDDNAIIRNFDIQTKLNFEWLIKYGARVNIWIISGLNSRAEIDQLPRIELYRVKIFGYTDPKYREKLNGFVPPTILDSLQPDRHFVTKIGSEWIRFWAPKLQC